MTKGHKYTDVETGIVYTFIMTSGDYMLFYAATHLLVDDDDSAYIAPFHQFVRPALFEARFEAL